MSLELYRYWNVECSDVVCFVTMQDARLAQQQQQTCKHNSHGRKQKDSSATARTASGRVAKQPTSVGAAAQRLARLCLRQQ